ncbi:MAG: amidohydrolase family protein [Clostridia bacterium]|nr:amidohydrolase family protein [Clostridia bacterium]
MHAHMFDCYECNMLVDTPEKQLACMDRSGVELALFCSHDCLFGGYPFFEGDLAVVRRYPERFRMYMAVFSPDLDPDRDLSFAEEHRGQVIGLKFHGDTYRVPISDNRHAPYYEYADRYRLPVLFHTWHGSPFDGPEEAEKVLEKYHDFSFIAGHSFRDSFEDGVTMAKRYPNLYLELTAVLSQRGMLEHFVEAGLEDRILFGVDAPWFSYDFGIGALLSADITDEVRRKILYKNAVALLQRADVDLPDICKRPAER